MVSKVSENLVCLLCLFLCVTFRHFGTDNMRIRCLCEIVLHFVGIDGNYVQLPYLVCDEICAFSADFMTIFVHV